MQDQEAAGAEAMQALRTGVCLHCHPSAPDDEFANFISIVVRRRPRVLLSFSKHVALGLVLVRSLFVGYILPVLWLGSRGKDVLMKRLSFPTHVMI